MKRFFLFAAFLFFSFAAFAVDLKDFSLYVEPLCGMKWGQINEYVFYNNSYFSRDKLSELNWEIKPEKYLGAKISGGWKNVF